MNIVLLPKEAIGRADYVINDSAQVSHIMHVLKLSVGDTLKVGCKGGQLGQATIANISHARIELTNINCHRMPPAKLDLSIILALPRPKVLRRLLIDMTAIGVKEIVLVNSYRTDKSYWQSPMLERIDEFVREGLQQGVDTIAPNILLKKRFKPFVEDELSVWTQTKSAIVAHPKIDVADTYDYDSKPSNSAISNNPISNSPISNNAVPRNNIPFSMYLSNHRLPQIICIGAEGGWIDYEVDLLTANGCQIVNIGQRILRTEATVNALCGRYL